VHEIITAFGVLSLNFWMLQFKLAQSKNHLQRIHLLEDTKQKLDAATKDLLTERAKFLHFSARIKKFIPDKSLLNQLEAEMQSWLEKAEAELSLQAKKEQIIISIVRLLDAHLVSEAKPDGSSNGDEEKKSELSDTVLSESLSKLQTLVDRINELQKELEDKERQLRAAETRQILMAKQGEMSQFKSAVKLEFEPLSGIDSKPSTASSASASASSTSAAAIRRRSLAAAMVTQRRPAPSHQQQIDEEDDDDEVTFN
jgi:uncharacterized protein YnzC (UPF0291/DUF896 family)